MGGGVQRKGGRIADGQGRVPTRGHPPRMIIDGGGAQGKGGVAQNSRLMGETREGSQGGGIAFW